MLGKLMGKGGERRPKKDKAIIHESVPDEVLYPEGNSPETADTSWMNDVLPEAAPAPVASTPSTRGAPAETGAPAAPPAMRPTPRQAPAKPATNEAVNFPDVPANATGVARPRYPVGWLVVVEGQGTGTWFPLEPGVSSLGWSAERTIQLPDPVTSDMGSASAAVSYDKDSNTFAVKTLGGEAVRLNGLELKGPARLRDGDVFSFGGLAIRLVCLCGGNFRWSDTETA